MGTARKGGMAATSYVHSGVQFESHAPPDAPPEDHVEELLGRLAPSSQAIRRFATEASESDPETVAVQFRLVVEAVEPEVGVSFSSKLLAQIENLGAAFLGIEVAFTPPD
jgi:hypothetical protein